MINLSQINNFNDNYVKSLLNINDIPYNSRNNDLNIYNISYLYFKAGILDVNKRRSDETLKVLDKIIENDNIDFYNFLLENSFLSVDDELVYAFYNESEKIINRIYQYISEYGLNEYKTAIHVMAIEEALVIAIEKGNLKFFESQIYKLGNIPNTIRFLAEIKNYENSEKYQKVILNILIDNNVDFSEIIDLVPENLVIEYFKNNKIKDTDGVDINTAVFEKKTLILKYLLKNNKYEKSFLVKLLYISAYNNDINIIKCFYDHNFKFRESLYEILAYELFYDDTRNIISELFKESVKQNKLYFSKYDIFNVLEQSMINNNPDIFTFIIRQGIKRKNGIVIQNVLINYNGLRKIAQKHKRLDFMKKV